jgi:predicted P-loop ATPase
MSDKVLDTPMEIRLTQVKGNILTAFKHGEKLNPQSKKQYATKYLISEEEVQKVYNYVVKKHQSLFNIENKPEIYKIFAFLKARYRVRYDQIHDKRFSIRRKSGVITDDRIVWNDCKREGYSKITLQSLDAMLFELQEPFDPIAEFFDGLPAWDGIDYIEDFAACVKTTDDPYWRSQFRKNLVRSIPCGLGKMENRYIMTLVGGEKTGKTSFIRNLCPFDNFEFYTQESFTDDKDTKIAMRENFIYNIDELGGLSKKNIERFKSAVSQFQMNVRRLYRADNERFTRRCNFWGCTNDTNFLFDSGGNTRWLIFEVKSIDYQRYNAIDVKMVWAQAYHLYKLGFDTTLTEEEITKQKANNESYEVGGDEFDIVASLFVKDDTNFLSNYDIKQHISNQTVLGRILNHKELSAALKKVGATSKTIKNQRGWCVRAVFPDANRVNEPMPF